MTRKHLLILVLILMLVLALLPIDSVQGQANSVTHFVYTDDDFRFDAELDGIVHYSIDEDSGKLRMQSGALRRGVFPRVRWIDIDCDQASDDWPASHTPEWAADTYIRAEVDRLYRSLAEESGPRPNVASGEHSVQGRDYRTFEFTVAGESIAAKGGAFHFTYYLYFSGDYESSKTYCILAYSDLRHKDVTFWLTPELIQPVLASFETGSGLATGTSTVTWSFLDGMHVVKDELNFNRATYSYNAGKGPSFSFTVDGGWHPTEEPGLLETDDGKGMVGALLRSEEDLRNYHGDTLVKRAAAWHKEAMDERRGKKAKESSVEPFDCRYPGTVRWCAKWPYKMYGQKFVAEVVRYIAEVRPGWAIVVTSSATVGGDDMARKLFDSMCFCDEPGCLKTIPEHGGELPQQEQTAVPSGRP